MKLTKKFGGFCDRNARVVLFDLFTFLANEEKVRRHWALWHALNLGLFLFGLWFLGLTTRPFTLLFLLSFLLLFGRLDLATVVLNWFTYVKFLKCDQD